MNPGDSCWIYLQTDGGCWQIGYHEAIWDSG
jgi:hypothetical protein